MKYELQRIRVNVVSRPRFAVMEGRDYIVLPVVILAEGVHSGSNGPVLYLSEDMKKYAPAWNHKPIVVYHPKKGEEYVSADDPTILSASKVGVLMANQVNGTDQSAEAWLEKERLKKVDKRVLEAIDEGIIVEVSTGLFTDNEEKEGEWNGEEYHAIARNYRPDHLALLPDLVGACSVKDGCGMFTASEGMTKDKAEKVQVVLNGAFSGEKDEELYESQLLEVLGLTVNPVHACKLNGKPGYQWGEQKCYTYTKGDDTGRKAAKRKAHLQGAAIEANSQLQLNELSHDDLRQKLWEKISPTKSDSYSSHYIQEVYDDYFVYGSGDDFYKQKFKVTDDYCELVGDPQKVKREVSYQPIGDNQMEKTNCDCDQEVKTLVDGLILAKKSWAEEDREWLQKQDEKMLKKLQAMESTKNKGSEKKEEDVTDNSTPSSGKRAQEMTTEEYLKNAPLHIRKVLLSGLKAHEAEEKRLRDIILSNEMNQFSDDDLKDMEFSMLQKLAALAIAAQEEEKDQPVDLFSYNFQGAAGAPQTHEKHQEDHLPLPVMNFSKDKDK